jgi:hypothetical protein
VTKNDQKPCRQLSRDEISGKNSMKPIIAGGLDKNSSGPASVEIFGDSFKSATKSSSGCAAPVREPDATR